MNAKRPQAIWTTTFPDQHQRLHPELTKAGGVKVNPRREYIRQKKRFLKENPICMVWPMKGNHPRPSVDVHHVRGRWGSLLTDERYWLAVSREAHDEIHRHPEAARQSGYLCAQGEWNKQ